MGIDQIKDIIRTFSTPAVATGSLTQAQLDCAIESISGDGVQRDKLITYKQAAVQLSLSTKTIKRMVDSGELQAKRLRAGCAKSVRVFQSSVDAILTPSSEDAV